MDYHNKVSEAAGYVTERLSNRIGPFSSKVGVVLGSGLGGVVKSVTQPVTIPYCEIPHFPQSTVAGHIGQIVGGFLGESPVVIMQGRVHYYEGYTPTQVTFPIRVLGVLGVRAVVLTNAAGAIREGYRVGQLVALADHINFMGWNPLVGANEPRFATAVGTGARFLDMTNAYSERLRALAKESAAAEGIVLDQGVYMAVPGPSYETPAEVRAFRGLGADLVGMSTVPETVVARHMGIEVLGLSCVTNLAAGLSSNQLSHEEVSEVGLHAQRRLANLLARMVPQMEKHEGATQ